MEGLTHNPSAPEENPTSQESSERVLSPAERTAKGEAILADFLENELKPHVTGLVQALAGLQRDRSRRAHLIKGSYEQFEIPMLVPDKEFQEIVNILGRAVDLLDGPLDIEEAIRKEGVDLVRKDLEVIFKNLDLIYIAACDLHTVLQKGSENLYRFNGENEETPDSHESNVWFDSESLNTALVLSRELVDASQKMRKSSLEKGKEISSRKAA